MIRFNQLPGRPTGWNRSIAGYATKTIFHESAWLDHIQTIHPSGKVVYYDIRDGADFLGFYCALRITKMLIPIQGSPLGGTGTNYMGPLVDESTDQRPLIHALCSLFGPRHFLHLELSNPWLDRIVMESAGFQVQESVTHFLPLPRDLNAAWSMLKPQAKNRVRKAEKSGVVIERTDDPAIADHFFDQFVETYGKQGMTTPFSRERPRSLFNNLNPTGRMLSLWARKGNEILGAGFFPFDERCIYAWGTTSWLRYQPLCPNEALHWAVIKFAVESGISGYNMCGGTSQFKNKFGGADIPYLTYYKSAVPMLESARRFYGARHSRKFGRKPQVER